MVMQAINAILILKFTTMAIRLRLMIKMYNTITLLLPLILFAASGFFKFNAEPVKANTNAVAVKSQSIDNKAGKNQDKKIWIRQNLFSPE